MATSPIADELSALEQARSRLEAILAGDENWRALTRPGRRDGSAAVRAARQARNTRLEMALAGNAHYQAWKHVNGAIEALRATGSARAQAAEPLVRPAPAGAATGGSADLPDDVAALLHDEAPRATPHAAPPRGEGPAAQPVGPAPSARAGLVERLEQLEEEPAGDSAASARPGVEARPGVQGRARKQERKADPVPVDPPEATVTFVVRESRAPPAASTEPDLTAERNAAMFERLRSLDAAAPSEQTHSRPEDSGEEAEVTIISAEGLVQRRQAEERSTIVRRFRKALSGD